MMLKSKTARRLLRLISLLGFCGFLLSRLETHLMTMPYGVRAPRRTRSNGTEGPVPYDAMVLTYMRSGSTFVGDVLGSRNDTCYWYEPLCKPHRWEYLSKEGKWCSYRVPNCGKGTAGEEHSKENTLNFLLDMYIGDELSKYIDRFAPLQERAMFRGSTDADRRCERASSVCERCDVKKGPNRDECYNCLNAAWEACFNKAMLNCPKLKHRVSKVLRMSAVHAQYLLERHERLKVIHVFRDPRAVINSRINTPWFYIHGKYSPSMDTALLCKRMSEDIAAAEKLRKMYPERVKIIQYEDFYDPRRLAVKLYDFLNMSMTAQAEELVEKLTNVDSAGKKGFHPDSYRQKMDWKMVESIDKTCAGVIKSLGLRLFKDAKELVNTNISVVVDSLPYTID